MEALELAVIEFNDDIPKGNEDHEVFTIAKDIVKGRYLNFLSYQPLVDILEDANDPDLEDVQQKLFAIVDGVEDHLVSVKNDANATLSIMLCGVSALMVFIQSNWTGPPLTQKKSLFNEEDLESLIGILSIDGESVYKHIKDLDYFALAKAILVDNNNIITGLKSKYWWGARLLCKYQEILGGPSEYVRTNALSYFNKALFAYENNPRLMLEHGFLYHFYWDNTTAKTHFMQAKDASQLYLKLSGMMGRRTKYQTFDTPQLVLMAKSTENQQEDEKLDKEVLYLAPDEEDIRLEDIKFVENEDEDFANKNLSVLDQCIITALCLDVKNQNPRHGLTWEQMKAYVERLMKNPNNWMVYTMALLIKSRLEVLHGKYADRAALQMQVLIDQFSDDESSQEYPVSIRCKYIFQIFFPALYRLKKELAGVYLRLGAARSAKQLYEELGMWYKVVKCLVIEKQVEKARALLDEKIGSEGETPELLCAQADIEDNIEEKIRLYTRAWEVSKGRFPRAKRNLGKIAMDDKDYNLAIKHYTEALEKNPQYGFAWFRLGCCALFTENFELAQRCFTRVTFLHPDDGEAWSNLATSCLKLNKIKEAYIAYKQSLKYNQENWKIWENLLFLCVRLNYVQESIYTMQRILNITERVDVQILDVVIEKVFTNEQKSKFTFQQLDNLVLDIKEKVASDPKLWSTISKYYEALGEDKLAVEHRQKQIRTLEAKEWDSDSTVFSEIVTALEKLTNKVLNMKDDALIYSTKLQVQSMTKKSEERYQGTADYKTLFSLQSKFTTQ